MDEVKCAVSVEQTFVARISSTIKWKYQVIKEYMKYKTFNFAMWLIRSVTTDSGLVNHAKHEFALAYKSTDEMDVLMKQNVIDLLIVFSQQGHSGFSAPYAIAMFDKLVNHQPISALSGEDDEWIDQSEPSGYELYQHKRFSSIFKQGKDGQAYWIDGYIFEQPDGVRYTSSKSRKNITFPYTIEESIVIKVDENGIPLLKKDRKLTGFEEN